MILSKAYKLHIFLKFISKNVSSDNRISLGVEDRLHVDLEVPVSYLSDGHKAINGKVINKTISGLWYNFHWRLHKSHQVEGVD